MSLGFGPKPSAEVRLSTQGAEERRELSPGVRWRGHCVAPDVPEFVIDPTSVGSDLPPAEFSRAQFRRVFDVEDVLPRVPLRLSADSRYVLWVNGDAAVAAAKHQDLDELVDDHAVGNAGTVAAQRVADTSRRNQPMELVPHGLRDARWPSRHGTSR